jgi:preprotein translocase SecE subunit
MAKKKANKDKPGGVVKEVQSSTFKFFGDVWREVHPRTGRVAWPSMKSVKASTIVVILSSIFLGLYIFACDFIVNKLYGYIMGVGSAS